MSVEIVIVVAALLVALVPLLFARGARRGAMGVALLVAIVATSSLAIRGIDTDPAPNQDTPEQVRRDGYVSSDACRACHPDEYDTWRASYHRTMTQRVSPATVLADFDDVELVTRGLTYRLSREGDEFWVDMVDPDWEMRQIRQNVDPRKVLDAPRAKKKIVMSTGSHWQQTYWVPLDDDRSMFQLPWTYLLDDKRWVPREDAFLHPPSQARTPVLWNTSCIKCHSTGGRPGRNENTNLMHSEVADFGISCESCHGPGAEHIEANQDPLRRYSLHLGDKPDETIVNPERLDHREVSMVCGQCHSFNQTRDKKGWWQEGYRYRPGDDLDVTRKISVPKPGANVNGGEFFSDGTYRIGGREYIGMLRSACYLNGEMTCLSCHSMHESEPNDQLASGMRTDEACLQCHESYRGLESHTNHATESEGSRCYNCHMPHTAYALFSGIRSHQVDSPTANMTLKYRRPNACNLCHLDKSIAWTADFLNEWYGQPAKEITGDQATVSAAVLDVLSGNAAERVLWAWTLGWAPAQVASDADWQAQYLAQLLVDPYAAVRHVSYRSLLSLPGFGDFEFDYLADADELDAARERALAIWRKTVAGSEMGDHEVVLNSPALLPEEDFERLLGARDDQPVSIFE